MTCVEHTIAIRPPIDEVFDFITEPFKGAVWLSGVLDVEKMPPVRSAADSGAEST